MSPNLKAVVTIVDEDTGNIICKDSIIKPNWSRCNAILNGFIYNFNINIFLPAETIGDWVERRSK